MSILAEILATKRVEVAARSKEQPLHELEARLADAPPLRDFVSALAKAPAPAIIAEVKKASPSKGIIRADFEPVSIAKIYAENGAACLSILTDENYFQGHLDYLTAIRAAVEIPLLRKEFIVDPWQLAESRAAGADAILLIVAALTKVELRNLMATASAYGLTTLVEVHDSEEMTVALDCGATLIGINNRDLHTFITSLDTTVRLIDGIRVAGEAPENLRIVSESGIFTHSDLVTLREAGATAALIGEAMMREADIGAKLREFINGGA